MSYSGICGAENIQIQSDANFHSESIAQIDSYTSAGGSCYSLVSANNPNEPVAGAGNDYVIPKGTPFQLSGSASDADSDTLSYQWDQTDLGSITSAATLGTDLGDNPLFRSFPPQVSAVRDFPALGTQVDGLSDLSEALPCTSRDLNFRLTVRDGKSGQATDEVTLTVDNTAGPFGITSHSTASTIIANAGTVDVFWDVANTDNALLNCSTVDIDLLTFASGHASYGITSLQAGTANDGSEAVTIPDSANDRARFRVSCSTNIFYDISDADLVIQGAGVFPTNDQQTFFNTSGESFSASAGECTATIVDTDNDGVADADDAFPNDPTEWSDNDSDGTGDNADTDDDNDGVLDVNDAFPLDASESVDTDSDGIGNNADPDDDNDGVADGSDAFPLDPSESVDTDSDGIGNNADTDDDNDGVLDVNDAFPLAASESVDTDSEGTRDNADTDDDNDGVLDVNDAFP
ncbi:MAG: hypothetical protein GY783_03295, partial [Gammaproteobacteria bacterium]|nr:hypothetical protein [Gammaproteobacteria bacterium]